MWEFQSRLSKEELEEARRQANYGHPNQRPTKLDIRLFKGEVHVPPYDPEYVYLDEVKDIKDEA